MKDLLSLQAYEYLLLSMILLGYYFTVSLRRCSRLEHLLLPFRLQQ